MKARIVLRTLPLLGAVAGLAGLLAVIDPGAIASAMRRFDARALLPIVALLLAFYALQGLRWHFLLRSAGIRSQLGRSQLINLAGQALTTVIPMGDLTRAVMASRSTGAELGATVATVTVQELIFMLLVVAAAAPGVAHLPNGLLWTLVLLGGLTAVFAILTVRRMFRGVRRAVVALPFTHRAVAHLDVLQREVCRLLRRPGVLAGSVLDLGRVLAATAAFALILHAMHIDVLSWWDAALVVAASFVGGALSFLPGGVGANEASVVGVLALFGVHPAAAAAAALMQRLTLTLVPAVGGALAYLALRTRRRRAAPHARRSCVSDAHNVAWAAS